MSFKQLPTTDAPVHLIRRTIELPVSFESFTKTLESGLGRYNDAALKALKTDEELENTVAAIVGTGLLGIFAIYNHGALIGLTGRHAKAKHYVIGDPRLAKKMTSQDVRAALHAPVHMLVYEVDGIAKIDYFTATSLFGQFNNAHIDEAAGGVEKKRETVIERVMADIVAVAQT